MVVSEGRSRSTYELTVAKASEIDDSLDGCLRTLGLWVINAMSNDDASSTILYDFLLFAGSITRRVCKGETAICKVQFVKNRDRFSDQSVCESVCNGKRATPIIAGSPVTY